MGKTLLTSLLLAHARAEGGDTVAMKPFCSGSRSDVDVLQSLQKGELSDAEMNPFYFRRALAPLAASGRKRAISLNEAVRCVTAVAERHDFVLVEGIGGVLVPLGRDFTVLDWIDQLRCSVVVVAANRLGTLNHTLLSVGALLGVAPPVLRVVLSEPCPRPGGMERSNLKILKEWLDPVIVERLPWLSGSDSPNGLVRSHCKKLKKTLARILESDSFSPSLG